MLSWEFDGKGRPLATGWLVLAVQNILIDSKVEARSGYGMAWSRPGIALEHCNICNYQYDIACRGGLQGCIGNANWSF